MLQKNNETFKESWKHIFYGTNEWVRRKEKGKGAVGNFPLELFVRISIPFIFFLSYGFMDVVNILHIVKKKHY